MLEVKKQVKQVDASQFRTQLDALGLHIIEVTTDENCFFRSGLGISMCTCTQNTNLAFLMLKLRALADQLEGNEEEHQKYRNMVVKHILV
ncbi:hypothetical protein VNO77_19118 [Canavalia gladiata]|uniref:OTU domain-containing protein n=1 Tax=Canavalia gladiata TaxID=3824 RepID=A0AAN9LM67_CANGL